MKVLKRNLLLLALALTAGAAPAQELTRELKSFRKIVVSPRINLVLDQGDHESVRLTYSNITQDKINIKVQGNTLRIYLEDAKVTERMEPKGGHNRRSVYHDVTVTAYVTYKQLEHLQIRGNQELTCNSPLTAERFILKAYGENEIRLASIKTNYFKTSLYGENDLKIAGGKAEYQKYKLFGENKIDTRDLKSYSATANIFGESKLHLTTQDELKINAFGESEVSYFGNANVNKGLMFGHTEINKLN